MVVVLGEVSTLAVSGNPYPAIPRLLTEVNPPGNPAIQAARRKAGSISQIATNALASDGREPCGPRPVYGYVLATVFLR